MSFTVEHIKNGKVVPIKLSIWDAFKGVPNPRPRKPKPCMCCKQVHSGNVSSEPPACDKKNEETSNKKPDGKSESKPELKNGDAQAHSNRPEETYNADDDAKIIAMKTADKQWKEILAEIGKESLSQLKGHWKSIDPTRKDKEGSGETKAGVDGEAKKKDEEKQAKIAKDKAEGQAAKKKKQEQEKNEPAMEKANEAIKAAIVVNDMRTFASQYDKQKWKAAASRHFDLTGQRVTPETARKMAEG